MKIIHAVLGKANPDRMNGVNKVAHQLAKTQQGMGHEVTVWGIASSLEHAVSTAQVTVPEVWDVRRTIEARTAALAALSRTDAEAARIVALAEAMADNFGNQADMARHDIAFHEAIARASHNALFVQLVSSFGPLMEVAVPTAWSTRTTDAERRTIIERHRAVADAILRGDARAAEAAMDEHFDASVGVLLEGMGSRGMG